MDTTKANQATDSQPTEIYNRGNGLTYTLVGDYYLPNLTAQPNIDYPLGIWARKRLAYLKEHKSVHYTNLVTTGEITTHLHEVGKLAEEWAYKLPIEMAKHEGVSEELKQKDPMRWVGLMNNIRSRVNELIENDIIYA